MKVIHQVYLAVAVDIVLDEDGKVTVGAVELDPEGQPWSQDVDSIWRSNDVDDEAEWIPNGDPSTGELHWAAGHAIEVLDTLFNAVRTAFPHNRR